MAEHAHSEPDYGTGQKKLGIYVFGVIACAVLTLISFWAVMTNSFDKGSVFLIILASAVVQLFVQVICFLRLNTQTEQARTNVMSIIFTMVILLVILVGSLWVMSNLNYNLMNM